MMKARGFTAVEVLVSMTLFAIGAAGVISMMRVSVQGNADARRFDMATQIAAEWQARLRRDSMAWTTPDTFNPTPNINTNTQFLASVSNLGAPAPSPDANWTMPPALTNTFGTSSVFDVLGREVAESTPNAFFCVNYRLDAFDANTPPTGPIRAEVRVFWPRNEQAPPPDCQPATATTNKANYHFLYTTTLVRRNAQ